MSDKEKKVRHKALETGTQLRQELIRLYRLGKVGELDTLDASRLAGILNMIISFDRETVAMNELLERLDALEGKTKLRVV